VPKESNTEAFFLDVDKETKKPIVQVDPNIAKYLKPHQREGVKFIWDCCFEKVELVKQGNEGSGCILAHCMGLGKTLQVIALVHTVMMNHQLTNVKRVLVLLPVNVLTNWRNEFTIWTEKCANKVKIYELPSEKGLERDLVRARIKVLSTWFEKGGVLLAGYTLFSMLVQGKKIKPKKYVEEFKQYLARPGADLVICDEGHMLKNEKTALNISVSQVKTQRRVILTGTPLQNNLIEYHCMVSFVKPSLLGTLKEFKNRFANPINAGQHKDSTETDVKFMKKRAHVLHDLLDDCVQRKDYSVIRNLLNPKYEYAIFIRLSDQQIELYKAYLKSRNIENGEILGKVHGAQLFSDYHELARIWTHPWALKLHEKKLIHREERAAEKAFINDDYDDEDEEELEGSFENVDVKSETTEASEENLIDDDDDIQEIGYVDKK
jgi:transcriptional regulator ATRX